MMLRFLIIFFIGTVLFSPFVKAQKIVFGPKVGFNLGTPVGKAEEGAKGSPGIGGLFGGFINYSVSDRFEIQVETIFSRKGNSFDTPASGQTYYEQEIAGNVYTFPTTFEGQVQGEFDNKYIEFPVLVLYKASEKLRIIIGPYFAYLLNGSITGTATGEIGDNYAYVVDKPFDDSEKLVDWDYGLVVGANYQIYKKLQVELRFASGLTSVYEKDYLNVPFTVRNVYMQCSFGYRFGDEI